ncbi:MAG: hypothetical protein QNJ04_01490 [Desulfobacterales bacterium]|nr:hypothetical protein [Desulfobacterales bacterium]
MPSRLTACTLGLLVLTATGCFHRPSPYMPVEWPRHPAPAASLVVTVESPRLQIIIGYFDLWPNHTALRLVAPDRPVIFWDPGGGYGLEAPKRTRTRDLIVDGAPDLHTYMPFRWYNNDALTEIFEWDLPGAEAQRMHRVLLAGAGIEPDPAIDFDTETPGFFCAAAISEFLHRFGRPSLWVETTTASPAQLSRALYAQQPDRVLLFYRQDRPGFQVMTPPPGAARRSRAARESGAVMESGPDSPAPHD